MSDAQPHHDDVTETTPVWRLSKGAGDHRVVRETVVAFMLNGRLLIRVSCLAHTLEDFALGFLASEGLVNGPQDISEVAVAKDLTSLSVRAEVDPYRLVAFRQRLAMSSGCGGAAACVEEDLPPVDSDARFRPEDLGERMSELQHASVLFRETGGVHCSGVTDGATLFAFAEDVGRHNAVDKTMGRSLAEGIALDSVALLTTGRLSGDILSKVIRVGVPVVVSRGAATSRAIGLARASGITAVGFARGRDMNVYTAAWRLGLSKEETP